LEVGDIAGLETCATNNPWAGRQPRHALLTLPGIHSPKLNQRVVVTFCCVKNWIAVLAHSAAGEVLEMLLQ
jgi:hypothetical protein